MTISTNNATIANNSSGRSTSAYETSVTLTYEGTNISFFRGDKVMVNATQMAKTFGKKPRNWLDLPGTTQFIDTLLAVRKSDRSEFIKTVNGVGTWFHQDVAIEFARWLSPAFAIWTNDMIKELMTTGVATVSNDDEAILHAITVLQKRVDNYRRQNQILEGQNQIQQAEIKTLAPKAEYTDNVLQSTNTHTMTNVAKELNFTSTNKFTAALKQQGIMFRQSGRWMLTSKYAGNKYTEVRTHHYLRSDGTPATNSITVWTEKGRAFLHQLRKGGKI